MKSGCSWAPYQWKHWIESSSLLMSQNQRLCILPHWSFILCLFYFIFLCITKTKIDSIYLYMYFLVHTKRSSKFKWYCFIFKGFRWCLSIIVRICNYILFTLYKYDIVLTWPMKFISFMLDFFFSVCYIFHKNG